MISWLGRWGQTCVLEYSNVAEHLILKLRPLKVHSKDHSVSDFLPPKVWIFYTQLCSVQRTRGFHVCTYILGEMQRGFWIASWDGCTSWTVQSLSWLVTIKGLLLVGYCYPWLIQKSSCVEKGEKITHLKEAAAWWEVRRAEPWQWSKETLPVPLDLLAWSSWSTGPAQTSCPGKKWFQKAHP